MGLKEVLDRLGRERSVRGAYPLDGEIYDKVVAEEGSVTESFTGVPLVNRALEEVLKRTTAVCLFCGSAFETPSEHVMIMEDICGNVVGHDVPPGMADKLKNDHGLFWLSDDFVMHPDRTDMHNIMMVMLPQRVVSIGEAEGAENAILLYPSTTTDLILRRHFGISPGEPDIASAIIAFDIIRE
ncbi:MAG: hypothetical protein FWD81_03515 [Methanomassiliicoccaceae archaeon]|nr:hypothetical protein [Methanomassiliicoccaceae archaeon]